MDKILNELSFSTMWNYMKSPDGAELLRQIMDLGFSKVELNYRISHTMLSAMEPLLEQGLIQVSSVHNVFPRIDNQAFDTDSLLLGYPDPDLRRQAVELTKQSVDYAHRLGAGVVVIHPGEVPVEPDRHYDRLLKELYRQRRQDSPEYRQLFQEMQAKRKRESPRYLELIKESLAQVGEYILQKNYQVSLGIENRAMCHQLPDFREAEGLIDALQGLPVYFWYDIGHGLMLEALGMFDSLAEATRIQSKIIGVHIHDTVGGVDDHWAPYIHSDQLDQFLGIIREAPLKVLELGSKNQAEAVVRGAQRLAERLAKFQPNRNRQESFINGKG